MDDVVDLCYSDIYDLTYNEKYRQWFTLKVQYLIKNLSKSSIFKQFKQFKPYKPLKSFNEYKIDHENDRHHRNITIGKEIVSSTLKTCSSLNYPNFNRTTTFQDSVFKCSRTNLKDICEIPISLINKFSDPNKVNTWFSTDFFKSMQDLGWQKQPQLSNNIFLYKNNINNIKNNNNQPHLPQYCIFAFFPDIKLTSFLHCYNDPDERKSWDPYSLKIETIFNDEITSSSTVSWIVKSPLPWGEKRQYIFVKRLLEDANIPCVVQIAISKDSISTEINEDCQMAANYYSILACFPFTTIDQNGFCLMQFYNENDSSIQWFSDSILNKILCSNISKLYLQAKKFQND